LNHPEVMSSFTTGPMILVSQDLSGSRRFGRVESPQTHIKLHHRSCSLCCAMVQTGSEELNHPKLMKNYPNIIVSSGAQWFEEVR